MLIRNARRVVAVALVVASLTGHAAETTAVDIPSGDLAAALEAYAKQTGVELVFRADQLKGLRTRGVQGMLSPQDAIAKLLQGTNLRLQQDRATGAMVIAPTPPPDTGSRPSASVEAQAETLSADTIELEEILVTGSHIRGVKYSASPILTYSREDIQRAGYASLDQFIVGLPQNSGAGASEHNVGTDSAVGNNGYGTAVNLRALGPGASLVLLNGRRLAPGGNSGRFIDISMIPLAAIERVDVLTDGASAIYGSDAVGGVVNFILRDDYEGAQTSARYGGVTSGDLRELQASQSFGSNWDGGGTLLAYEYHRRDALDARERTFASSTELPRTLLPEQERHSVYANIHHDLSERASIFSDVLYSNREADNQLAYLGLRNHEISSSDQLFASLGSRVDLGGSWKAQVSASYSQYELDASLLRTPVETGIGELTRTRVDTDVWSFDALADGAVLELPGGELRLALGAAYREESVQPMEGSIIPGRYVKAAFSELFIPLVGAANRGSGMEALELSIAARYEQYSDFGEDVTPKFGLRWQPVHGLSVRATYGESFKAPTVTDMAPGTEQVLAFIASDFDIDIDGDPLILLRTQSARPDLHEETSRSWTAGLDLQPSSAAYSMSLTYFHIEFTGRIDSPVSGGFSEFFGSPEVFGSYLLAHPGAAFVDERLAQATIFNDLTGGVFTPNNVDLWADASVTNIAEEKQSGVDVTLSFPFATRLGRFDWSVNGTYLTQFEKRVAPAAPARDVLNRLNQPIDLRVRSGLTWAGNRLSAGVFVNYLDSYRNTDEASSRIDSWTTLDGQLRYDFAGVRQQMLKGAKIVLNVQNLFDEAPPFVRSQGSPIAHPGYDSVNASPLGRFIALEIAKDW
jgi:outer membrane receptor protein involved in Fe transport